MLHRNLTPLNRVLRLLLAVLAGWIALYAFENPIARIVAGLVAVWSIVEAVSGHCPLHTRMGVNRPGDIPAADRLLFFALAGIQGVFAYVWWHAGWEKVTGTFSSGLPQTFARFASENPYGPYKTFLEEVAIPNAALFAPLIEWSQLLIGLTLSLCSLVMVYGRKRYQGPALTLSIAALLGGMLMNANFWLASAWTGPGGATSNVVMFWTALILVFAWSHLLRHRASP